MRKIPTLYTFTKQHIVSKKIMTENPTMTFIKSFLKR